MLKRLRKNHPLGYCVGAEVLFLGSLVLTSILVVFLLMLFRFDLAYADDYLLGCIQELVGVGVAVLLLKRTGKAQLLRKRGCGFFNGLLVGMYPLALLAYTLYTKILFGLPEDGTLLPLWRILSFLANMMLVGIAEEFLFRGVIAETLLEHFGTSRGGIWKACLLSGLLFAHLTNLLSSAPLGGADAVYLCSVAGGAVCGHLLPHRQPLGHGVLTWRHGHHLHARRRALRHRECGREREQLRCLDAAVGAGLPHPGGDPAAEKEDR